MISINFKKCCGLCVNRDSFLREEKLCSDDNTCLVSTSIGCKHECVCKEYSQEEGKAELPIKNISIGDPVTANVRRPYNNHIAYIHGNITDINKESKMFRVKYDENMYIDFYMDDINQTVFIMEKETK